MPVSEFDERFLKLEATFAEYRENIEHRLEELNRLREDVLDDRTMFLTKDLYLEQHTNFDKELDELKRWRAAKDVTIAASSNQLMVHDQRLAALEGWEYRVIGVGAVLVAIAGLVGAVLEHTLRVG